MSGLDETSGRKTHWEMVLFTTILFWASILFLPLDAVAQGTVADYQRALGLEDRLEDRVHGVMEEAHWSDSTHQFWYRKSVKGGHTFVLVDGERQQKQPAFDHEEIATVLSDSIEGESYTSTSLPFSTFEYVENRSEIEFEVDDATWRCRLDDTTCEQVEEATEPDEGDENWCGWLAEEEEDRERVVSPNGKKEAFIRNHDVYVRPTDSAGATAQPLSFEGAPGNGYEIESISWSPDSDKIAAYRVDRAPDRMIQYVVSSPDDQLQPKSYSCPYPKPGDELDDQQPVLFDVDTGEQIVVNDSLFPNPYNMSELEWWDDGRGFTFEYNQRGHQVYRVIEVDAETGEGSGAH